MYSVAFSSTVPSGVPIISRNSLEKISPNTPTHTPITRLSAMDVCTVSCMSRYLFAPLYCATMTAVPTDRPMNRLTMSVISEEVAPTEATASVLSN